MSIILCPVYRTVMFLYSCQLLNTVLCNVIATGTPHKPHILHKPGMFYVIMWSFHQDGNIAHSVSEISSDSLSGVHVHVSPVSRMNGVSDDMNVAGGACVVFLQEV